jgi:hypothetical protein
VRVWAKGTPRVCSIQGKYASTDALINSTDEVRRICNLRGMLLDGIVLLSE